MLTQEQSQRILSDAIQAPSADNRHPFRFEITDFSLRVWFAGPSMPAPGGYKRVLLLLSLGALSENIALAASALGLRTECKLSPDASRADLLLECGWEKYQASPDPRHEAIPKRHTNRRLWFHGPKLDVPMLEGLELATRGLPGCKLQWLDEPEVRKKALRLIRLAETERFRNAALHEELFSAIRFDVGWSKTSKEGLPPGALEVEWILRPVFKLMRHWPVMRAFNLFGAHVTMGYRAAWLPCRLSPHLGLIAAEKTDDQSIYTAGIALQRIWLTATGLELSFQPFPASALYALPGAVKESVPMNLQLELAQGWQKILPAGAVPVILFRLGRAKPPSLSASRQELSHYLRPA